MSKRQKRLLTTFFVLLGLAAAAMGGTFLYLASIVRQATEAAGQRITGTEVHLGSVNVVPWSGQGTIRDLTVASPDGFRTEHTVKASRVRFEVDPRSLVEKEGPVLVRWISVDGVAVTVEASSRGTNIDRILDQLNQAAESEREAPTGSSRKVVVENVALRGIKARLLAKVGGIEVERDVDFADIEVESIGAGSDGETTVEAASRILRPLCEQVQASQPLEPSPPDAADEPTNAGKAPSTRAKAVGDVAGKAGKRMRKALNSGY